MSSFLIYSGLLCRVSAGNDMACLTTDLLAAIGKMEPVFIPLVLAFRYWAKVSGTEECLICNKS